MIAIGVIVCLGFALAGCGAYRSVNMVRIQGTDIVASYSQLTQSFSFKGTTLQAGILRQSALVTEKVALTQPQMLNLPNLGEGDLTFKLDQNGQVVVDPTKPREPKKEKAPDRPLTAIMNITPVTK